MRELGEVTNEELKNHDCKEYSAKLKKKQTQTPE